MKRLIPLLLLIPLLAACGGRRTLEAGRCHGPAVPANAGKFEPTPEQRAMMDRMAAEVCRRAG